MAYHPTIPLTMGMMAVRIHATVDISSSGGETSAKFSQGFVEFMVKVQFNMYGIKG